MKKLRVLLAEDHETVRHGLRLLIDGQEDMEVVAEAPDGVVAVERAAAVDPDLVILDVSMPHMNGLAAARAIKTAAPRTAVVALTRHADEAYVQALLAAGASGYVLKQSSSSELLYAMRQASVGGQHVDRALTPRLPAAAPASPGSRSRPAITEREAEVLKLTAVGHSNKEIATRLDLSVKTVEVHKANAARKLGLRGRIAVIKYAVLQGWLRDP
jgi:two-component system, NarL family, response regulator NreC